MRDRLNTQKQKALDKGNDLVTKVYPSDVIPDQFIERKRDYRPNNFMSGEIEIVGGGSSMMRSNNRASNQRLMRHD